MEYRISNKLRELAPSAIREIFKSLTDPEIIAFAAGNPAAESFPVDFIREAAAQILRDTPTAALQYGITEGQPGLRSATRERLAGVFGIGREFDDTVIVTGGQQGIELACKTMCNEGDVVIAEDPSFIGALNAFRSNGARIVGVGVDDDGMDPEGLEAVLKAEPDAKLIYIIPTFQNPMGITTSLERRRAIYELARRYGVMILEDNPYGELRFAGENVPTLKSMDEDGIVIYCGSYSKVFSSGLRLGFVCAPKPVLSKMIVAKQVEDVHTNVLAQLVCERFITSDLFEGHLESIRALYRRKCGLMLDEMDRCFPKEIRYTRPQGGLFLWCTLPDGIELGGFVKDALARKVAVVPGSAFNCSPTAVSHSFRMNYSTPSDEQIARGVHILGEILTDRVKGL